LKFKHISTKRHDDITHAAHNSYITHVPQKTKETIMSRIKPIEIRSNTLGLKKDKFFK